MKGVANYLKAPSLFIDSRNVKLFHGCDPGLLKSLVLKLQPMIFLPNDYICRCPCHQTFFFYECPNKLECFSFLSLSSLL